MKQPSRALQDYLEGEKKEWWRVFLEALRQAWHRLWGASSREEVRLAVSSCLARLGMPPLPPPSKQRRSKSSRGWRTCRSGAISLVESGAAFRATERAANRLRRATVALDFCTPIPQPPNLDSLPLDRIANHRKLTLETVRTALATARRALPKKAFDDDGDDLYAGLVATVSAAIDDFDRGNESQAVDCLHTAKQGLDEARFWLEGSVPSFPKADRSLDEQARSRRKLLGAVREHFELAAAAVYKAEIGLVLSDDAERHAETALSMLRSERESTSSFVEDSKREDDETAEVVVFYSHDEESSPDRPDSPRVEFLESPTNANEEERHLFADRACGSGNDDPVVVVYREDDPPLKRSPAAYTVVAELERALRSRRSPYAKPSVDDEGEDDSLVLVEAPTTTDVASDPRYAGIATALSQRLSHQNRD